MTEKLIRAYHTAFNIRDIDGLLALLDDNVSHQVIPGGRTMGKLAFQAFVEERERCRQERTDDLAVMVSDDGRRAASEYTAYGAYVETEDGLPPAKGAEFSVTGGTFFVVIDGRIARITTYDNLPDLLWQQEPPGT